ncbi:MAG: YicC family protein [Faecalibacterium sp.]|nr:YicC family protein [Ruminococcus sp.]MCM1392235.1 YicC family protein [Ruminococcus sp.]MCM1484938.1 YicC family protein [Faecalibacterium sp.]
MIKSMTGYGRAQQTIEGMSISVEIKSVNHRYYEFSARVPRIYGFLEEKLKTHIKSAVSRGKIECYVYIESLEAEDCTVNVNHTLAKGYLDALTEIGERYGIPNDVTVTSIARYSDIFSIHKAEADEEKIWNCVKNVTDEALAAFIAMREKEGVKLKDDVLSRCDTILGDVEFIEIRSPQTVEEYNAKLLERMRTVLEDVHVDEQRLLTEAAIYADKIAVAEETVRLRSHIAQLHELMESNEAIGRKLDFLIQEFNREANTIGSKAQDVDIAKRVINIKSEIEKIREQIQNIE